MNAVLLIVIPLLAAFLSILSKKLAPIVLLIVSFAMIVLLVFVPEETIIIGGFTAPYGITLVLDTYSLFALYVINILFFLVAIINVMNYKQLGSILLVALAGLNGLLLTGDLFNLFVFLEITGISAYLITTTNKKPLHTFNYLVAGTVGSSLYLLGLIILYNMFGTLNMADMANAVSSVNPVYVAFPFLLMFMGLGVEAKLLPFNSWVKGILGTSNKLTGPMIAAVYASASLFVFGRLLTEVFVMSDQLMLIVSIILGFSILAGEAMAYSSSKVREILLFSSIAQAGIAVLVFSYGFTAFGLLFVAMNGFSKLVLFLVVNHVSDQRGTDEITDFKGIFASNKLVGLSFSVVVLSILGLPLFAGFFVKIGILQELFSTGNLVFPAIILISSVVEGVYFIKLLITLWYAKEEPIDVHFEKPLVILVLVIAALFVVLGVYWTPFTDFVNLLVGLKGGFLSWLV
jgi:multicomponent Na+:H+ antiporter subunit D